MIRTISAVRLLALPLALLVLGAAPASAQMYAPGSGEAVPAEELYEVCAFCHGPQGQGAHPGSKCSPFG